MKKTKNNQDLRGTRNEGPGTKKCQRVPGPRFLVPRSSFLAGLLILSAFATADEVKMKVYVNGKPTGNATLSQKVIANGQKMIDLGMVISSAGRQVTVHSESTYDAKGAPIRKYQDTLVLGKIRKSRRVIVSFDKGGANVVLVVDGDRTTKYVPLDPQADRADGSEFWFLKGIPKVGEEVHAYRFNLDTLNWDMVNTVYKGVRPMSIDNRRVVTYVTDSEEGTAYFGKDGLPLRLELPYAAMERIWEKS